jgi:ATP-dependent Lon protease
MSEQVEGVAIHYAKRIEDVLAVALPVSAAEQHTDDLVREDVLEHADA